MVVATTLSVLNLSLNCEIEQKIKVNLNWLRLAKLEKTDKDREQWITSIQLTNKEKIKR